MELKAKIVTQIFIKAVPFKLTTAMPSTFVTEPRVGFAVIREPDEMYSLFRETVSSNVTERALLTFYVITTSLGHPSPSL